MPDRVQIAGAENESTRFHHLLLGGANLPPVDIRGFSGAPIIDEKGYVVGVMTVWFDPKVSGDNFLEAGGEDIASIYDLVQRPN